MMSESVGSTNFDAEAQEYFLAEDEISSTSVDVKQKLQACILCIRSTLVFTHRRYASSSSSASSTYASIYISDDDPDHVHDQGSPPVASAQIELQQLQRENVSEIVKKKDLEVLREFGGVRGVAEALNTDLQNGLIIEPQQTSSYHPTQLHQFLLTAFHSFLESCKNCTVILLFCATALSLWFGMAEDGREMGWLNGVVLLVTVLWIVAGTTIQKCWEKWSSNKSKLKVKIVRGGCDCIVGEVDLVVGDIAIVKKGDHLPADGLFVGGSDCETLQIGDGSTIDEHNNPFMFYGSRVMSGEGRMLVTSIGSDTVWGEMMIGASNEECKFECYLNRLFLCLHRSGLLISILIMVVLFLRYHSGKLDDERRYRPESKGEPTQLKVLFDVFKAIVTGSKETARVFTLLSVSIVGIVDTVPLVISVSILMWSTKTLACKAMAIDSFACVNMARITTVCTDRLGALIGSHKLYIGEGFVREMSSVAPEVVKALRDVIVGDPEIDSLLWWAELTSNQPLQNGSRGIWHCKGTPHHILSKCSHHYNIDGQILEIDGQKRRMLERDIELMLAEDAQVIAYACKHIQDSTHHPPNHDLALLAIMIIRNTTVSRLKEEGIRTILASGEDVSLLKPIAHKCGLLSTHANNSDELVLTGEEFRRLLDEDERENIADKICIIGNCTPNDKFLLVKCLKEAGQAVAVVAHAAVDAPALKLADIGLTHNGNSSSEITRDYSDITLLDPNSCCFEFLLTGIKSGRCLLQNMRQFIQMQLIFVVSSSLINFTATVALGDAPITPIQLFCLSVVVPLVGGIALLTAAAVPLPNESSEKLMTRDLWRNVGFQVCYQTGVFVGVQYKGKDVLRTSGDRVKLSIYNAFFLCQMFNVFIARQPRKLNIFSGLSRSICWFWVALLLFIVCQAVIAAAEVVLGGGEGLSLKLWGGCLLIAFISWPVDFAAKMLFFVIGWI